MPLETIAIFLTLFFTAISLILTIIGWRKTYDYQRKILERQISAEKEKETRQILITRKLAQLRQVEDWIKTGQTLWHEWQNRPKGIDSENADLQEHRNQIDKKIAEWCDVEFTPIKAIIYSVEHIDDQILDTIPDSENPESLNEMITILRNATPTGNPNYYDENPKWSLDKSVIWNEYCPKILIRLELAATVIIDKQEI